MVEFDNYNECSVCKTKTRVLWGIGLCEQCLRRLKVALDKLK